MKKSPITTHILDTSVGRPARGVAVALERQDESGTWHDAGRGITDNDGRVGDLMEPGTLEAAIYRLRFDTGAYFAAAGRESFYPGVTVTFRVEATDEHYHVPLLLNPFGYSTYRGS